MKLSISEARKRLPELVRQVRKDVGAKGEIDEEPPALVDLGALTDDGDKDGLKGKKGIDELIGGIGDKLKQ